MHRSVTLTFAAVCVLGLACCAVWGAALGAERGSLHVSFLDVGQGDAVFIQSPTGRQVLVDGGHGSDVLRRLGERMPWYDRSLDLVIGTHADLDHIGGLIDVLARYRVDEALVPSTEGDSGAWRTYLSSLAAQEHSGTRVIAATRGERLDLGGGAYLEVLFPDRSLPHAETNTGCIVSRLVYGATAFMLPCDSPQMIENYLVALDGANLKSDVLKAGHHGSKTSSSPLFVGEVDPSYVVFSRGCDNVYGHPSKETVATFARFRIPTFDTCTDGTITFVSDGRVVVRN